jgi:molybdate transport system substrate-binding protein
MKRALHAFFVGVCLFGLPLQQTHAAIADAPQSIMVFAAASLTDALQALATQYRAQSTDMVRFSFAASSTLARQIEAGAPADIFVSANEEWMDYLGGRNLVEPATRVDPIGNTLVMIAAADSALAPVEIGRTFDLAGLVGKDEKLAIGDPTNVPVGMYAKKAFETLGVWASVAPSVAYADNVRAVLALVERGEAPLGVVYETDARASNKVKIIGAFPPDSHPPISYPFAIVAGKDTPSVRRFFQYVTTGPAAQVYKSFGFKWQGPTG